MRRAMIIGSGGQDGQLLFERLEREGCSLLGVERGRVRRDHRAAEASNIPVDILDQGSIDHAISAFAPQSVFYLAAYHHSAQDRSLPDDVELYLRSHDVHVRGLLYVLEALRTHVPQAALFYAASSRCFGDPSTSLQDENTPFRPQCPYGITKTAGIHLCRMYRTRHALRASAGILYNHESPLRAQDFLSTKVARAAVEISRGDRDKLVLGDLSARVDWGYAPDTVDAMVRILELEAAGDFVIATGQSHSVEEFVSIAFSHLGLEWRRHVEIDPSLIRASLVPLVGDSAKLRRLTGWSPSVGFRQMVELLVEAEARRA